MRSPQNIGHADGMDDIALYDDEFPLLEGNGLYAAPTSGAGDCLFHSLSDQLYGHENRHHEVRQRVVQHLRYNSRYFKAFIPVAPVRRAPRRRAAASSKADLEVHSESEIDKAYEQRLQRMQNSGVFGDNLEIQAFAREYGVDVKIYQREHAYVICADNESGDSARNGDRKVVHIAYHKWEHYSSIRNRAGPHTGLPCVSIRPVSPTTAKEALENSSVILPWMEEVVASSLPHIESLEKIREALEKCKGDVDATVGLLLDEFDPADSESNAMTPRTDSMDEEEDRHAEMDDMGVLQPRIQQTGPEEIEQQLHSEMERQLQSEMEQHLRPAVEQHLQPAIDQHVQQARKQQTQTQIEQQTPPGMKGQQTQPDMNGQLQQEMEYLPHPETKQNIQQIENHPFPELDQNLHPEQAEQFRSPAQPQTGSESIQEHAKTIALPIIQPYTHETAIHDVIEVNQGGLSRIKRRKSPDGSPVSASSLSSSSSSGSISSSDDVSSVGSSASSDSDPSERRRRKPAAKPAAALQPTRRSPRIRAKAETAATVTAVPPPSPPPLAPKQAPRARKQTQPRPAKRKPATTSGRKRKEAAGMGVVTVGIRELYV